jgi:hypothetical protein
MVTKIKASLVIAITGLLVIAVFVFSPVYAQNFDPLPSWNNGQTKSAIIEFVEDVTKKGGVDYVSPEERIATFDNDGTLWVEYPMYTQVLFIFDRVKEIAPQHPEWKTTQPFKALLEGDMKTVGESGEKGILQMGMATHSGMNANEFEKIVLKWLATNKQSRFKRLYTECVYQPQLELIEYLHNNGFKVFIVSGGGIQFMRPWSGKTYGIEPDRVVGSSVVSEFQINNGTPELVRMQKIDFVNDKGGKPVGIYEHIGQRPILAFGNSDGDMQMIQYTMAGDGRRMGLFVHHTDENREYAYDRESHVGKLDKVLDLAESNDWIIVDMKKDWEQIFPDK